MFQMDQPELAEGGDLDRLENQVYSDLHTSFSRYYQDGALRATPALQCRNHQTSPISPLDRRGNGQDTYL
jgi:hypothetical protein